MEIIPFEICSVCQKEGWGVFRDGKCWKHSYYTHCSKCGTGALLFQDNCCWTCTSFCNDEFDKFQYINSVQAYLYRSGFQPSSKITMLGKKTYSSIIATETERIFNHIINYNYIYNKPIINKPYNYKYIYNKPIKPDNSRYINSDLYKKAYLWLLIQYYPKRKRRAHPSLESPKISEVSEDSEASEYFSDSTPDGSEYSEGSDDDSYFSDSTPDVSDDSFVSTEN